MTNQRRLSRRMFLGGGIGVAGLASNVLSLQSAYASPATSHAADIASIDAMSHNSTGQFSNASHDLQAMTRLDLSARASGLPFLGGDVDPTLNGFDPTKILTDFDGGTVSKLPSGQTLRQYTIISTNKDIFPAPNQKFAAWTYNGRVPGPTIRATAGDHIRIHYINKGDAAHGIHFHGIHAGNVDAGFQSIIPGSETFYEFDAQPAGVHMYHCHMSSLAMHIVKGLYGFFIIDPPQPRPKAQELVMMMNNFTFKPITIGSTSDLYAINTVAYHYLKHPIPVRVNQLVRVYLGNIVEFDNLVGFRMHSNLFNFFPTGTGTQPAEVTDSVMMCQGQRGILEFSFKTPGQYLFRSIYSQAADKGFIGAFQAV
jgi:FtsP/CotA-like multicopper oxidase with cupredoxin domain